MRIILCTYHDDIFGESREINWDVLHEVSLDEEVNRLLSASALRQLFRITDTTYKRLVLEVLATFKLSEGTVAFHHADVI